MLLNSAYRFTPLGVLMTATLSDNLRQALEQAGGTPVHLIEAVTNTHYVIMRADQYEQVKALFEEEEAEFHPRELDPLVAETFGRAGWDEPEMDVYNDYDAHRPKP
jgi:16S rRNA U1498 N3-methylase RsmE